VRRHNTVVELSWVAGANRQQIRKCKKPSALPFPSFCLRSLFELHRRCCFMITRLLFICTQTTRCVNPSNVARVHCFRPPFASSSLILSMSWTPTLIQYFHLFLLTPFCFPCRRLLSLSLALSASPTLCLSLLPSTFLLVPLAFVSFTLAFCPSSLLMFPFLSRFIYLGLSLYLFLSLSLSLSFSLSLSLSYFGRGCPPSHSAVLVHVAAGQAVLFTPDGH
jgi:hypothetical protein